MAKGKVEFEIYRSWEGCRWNWNVWLDDEPYKHGVEDTVKKAMDAALNAYELRSDA